MGFDKYTDNAIKSLSKAGKAPLDIQLVPHPNDKMYTEVVLCADVYILSEKEDIEKLVDNLPAQCFRGSISSQKGLSCEIVVETIYGIGKRFLKNKRREAKEVVLVIVPSQDFSDKYDRSVYKRKFNSGQVVPVNVSLKPKNNTDSNNSTESEKLRKF